MTSISADKGGGYSYGRDILFAAMICTPRRDIVLQSVNAVNEYLFARNITYPPARLSILGVLAVLTPPYFADCPPDRQMYMMDQFGDNFTSWYAKTVYIINDSYDTYIYE